MSIQYWFTAVVVGFHLDVVSCYLARRGVRRGAESSACESDLDRLSRAVFPVHVLSVSASRPRLWAWPPCAGHVTARRDVSRRLVT